MFDRKWVKSYPCFVEFWVARKKDFRNNAIKASPDLLESKVTSAMELFAKIAKI